MAALRISYQTIAFDKVDIHLRTLRNRTGGKDKGSIAESPRGRLAETVRTGFATTGNIQHRDLALTSGGDAASLPSH